MANQHPHRPHHMAPWTDQEKGLLELRFELGGSLDELADHHGRTRGAIAGQLERQGLVTKIESPEAAGVFFKIERDDSGEIERLSRYADLRDRANRD